MKPKDLCKTFGWNIFYLIYFGSLLCHGASHCWVPIEDCETVFLELLPIFFINIDAKSMMRTNKDLSKITEDFDVITEEFNIFALMLDKGYFK